MIAPEHPRRDPLTAPLAVLAVLAAGILGCQAREGAPRDLGTRAVVIGLDGADWKLVDELAARGRMPNLTRLRAAGVSGPISTLGDVPLSPVIWTSVATGKTAAKHGIGWFMVDQADGTRVPVRSSNRKVAALWNILGAEHRRPVVVGWWATCPAENVGSGVVVSDALGFHGFGATAREGDDGKKTYPGSLYARLDPLVPPEQQLPYSFVERFVHLAPTEYREEMFDPGRSPRHDPTNPIHLFQQYAVTAQGYTAIAERLLAEERCDLVLVYFEQIDSFSHLFMKYAPPPLPWVDPKAAARYRDVVTEWYAYQDELLGRLLAAIDLEETAVFVLSDHGFKSGERRIRSEATVDVKRAHLDHEEHGIFLAAGPHLKRGARVEGASVLDLAPTVLFYLGFPVAKDMDGKVLSELFEPSFTGANPLRYVASFEPPAAARPAVAASEKTTRAETEEREKALRALGYLGGSAKSVPATQDAAESSPGATGAVGTQESSPEIHNNLGRIHLRDGKLREARREFEQALDLDPRNADALLNLATLDGAEGRTAEAERLVQRALQVNPDSAGALAQLAELRRDQGDLPGAIRLFEEALRVEGSQPFLHLGLGDCLQRAGRYAEAERAFRKVLELDPDSFKARYNLGVTYGNQGRLDAAEAEYREALAKAPKDPEAPKALNNLGYLELQRGHVAAAVAWFEKAVAASPDHFESRYNLAMQYLSKSRLDDAIRLLEEASALSPNHQLVHERLGLAYLEKGRSEDAYRSFLLVRRLYSKNWIAPLGLAVLHAAAKRPREAQSLLDEAFRLGGDEARRQAASYPALARLRGASK